MTKYEKEIYNIITHSTGHLTVEQIYLELKKKCPKVVLATVYNNVNKLWKAGRIRKISVENMPDRYDQISGYFVGRFDCFSARTDGGRVSVL